MKRNWLYILTVALSLAYLRESVAPIDLWRHVLSGESILHGDFAFLNTTAYLPAVQRPIDPTWLTDTIFAAIATLPRGLACLRLLVVATIFSFVAWTFASARIFVLPSLIAVGLAAVLASQVGLEQVSPTMFACLLFVLQLLIVLRAEQNSSKFQLFTLPVLFLLWANIDSTVIVGLLLLLLAACLRLVSPLIFVLCSIVCLINPFGFSLLSFDWRDIFQARIGIFPLNHPLHGGSPLGMLYLCLGLLAAWLAHKAEMESKRAVLFGACFLLPFYSIRFLPEAVLGSEILLALPLGAYCSKLRILLPVERACNRSGVVWTALGLSLAFVGWSIISTVQLRDSESMPQRALAFLSTRVQSGTLTNVACCWQWADYAQWQLRRAKFSIDTRWDSAYSKEACAINMRFTGGAMPWDMLLPFSDVVLVSKRTVSYSLMKARKDWKSAYEDELAAVFLPVNSVRQTF